MNAIVELRQYTLKPDRRDVLIDLFEREFVESQEAEGMDIIGTFRDARDSDRFVWLRGFPDMDARAGSLAAFYGGPTWKRHRDAANATMIDSDNVLLLTPAWDGSGFPARDTRAPVGAAARAGGCLTAAIHYFDAEVPEDFVAAVRAAMPATGISACFVTEASPNSFPALPVRAGENVLVSFGRDAAQILPSGLERHLSKPVEVLRLLPTARSRLSSAG
jgi:hypothetical protein